MMKRLLQSTTSITTAAIIVSLSSLASRILGVIRDRLLAAEFGAGDVLDMYYAAFRLPDIIYNFIIFGALSAGFIPILISYLQKKNKKEITEFFSSVMNLLVAGVIVLSLLIFFFSPLLVPLLTPGFEGEKLQNTILMTRLMTLSPIILGISGVISGALQSLKRFVWYALAPVMYNVGIIIGVVWFVKFWGIWGLAYGVILGAILHLLIQLPGLFHSPIHYRFTYAFSKGVKEVIVMMGPRVLTLALQQIQFVIMTVFASLMAVGSIAIFQLSFNLQSFSVGLFGVSFAVAAFPTLSEMVAKNDMKEFVHRLSETIMQILFFVIPSTVIFIVLRAQIVRLILGSGRFDWEDTILTADALGVFAISLFAQCLIPLLVRCYYALSDSKTPFWIGMISTLIYVGAAWYFSEMFGFIGLVFSFSLLNLIYMMFLLIVLYNRLGTLQEYKIFISSFKIFFASMVMGIAIQSTKYVVASFVDMQTGLGIFTQTMSSLIIGAIVFITISMWVKSKEMQTFLDAIFCKLKCVREIPKFFISPE